MKKILLLSMILVFGVMSIASADLLGVGSITAADGGGITATDGWDNSLTILSWSVTYDSENSLYTYAYTFTTVQKALSHIIIEVSDTFTSDNIFDGTTVSELKTYTPNDPSNPYMQSQIYGLKFESSDDLSYDFQIITDRAPMYGSFYAKDGTMEEIWATAQSYGNVVVPDTTNGGGGGGNTVPEPGTMALLGAGLIGVAGIARRKR